MNKLHRFWGYLPESFWFVPSLIVVACIAIAVALIDADSAKSQPWVAHWPRLFGASTAGARDVVHNCQFNDDSGRRHVFHSPDNAGHGNLFEGRSE